MICPKCKIEYQEGFTVCSDCGVPLVKNDEKSSDDKTNWLNSFGKTNAQNAITGLFFLGIPPILLGAVTYGKYIFLTNKYMKDIFSFQNGQKVYTQMEVNNLPRGVILGILTFVFGVLVWKIVCELLIIIFRCFEAYVDRKK